jgi:hypothetical protein
MYLVGPVIGDSSVAISSVLSDYLILMCQLIIYLFIKIN